MPTGVMSYLSDQPFVKEFSGIMLTTQDEQTRSVQATASLKSDACAVQIERVPHRDSNADNETTATQLFSRCLSELPDCTDWCTCTARLGQGLGRHTTLTLG